MEDEKSLLKKDLERVKTKEEIEGLANDARELGHEDIAKLAEEKLAVVSAKAESAGATSQEKVKQVESLGGSGDEIANRTREIDSQINAVKVETEKRVGEVTGNTTEESPESSPEKEKVLAELLKLKGNINTTRTDLEYQKRVRSYDNKPNDDLPYNYPNLSLDELDKQIEETESGLKRYEEEYDKKLKETGTTDLDVQLYYMRRRDNA